MPEHKRDALIEKYLGYTSVSIVRRSQQCRSAQCPQCPSAELCTKTSSPGRLLVQTSDFFVQTRLKAGSRRPRLRRVRDERNPVLPRQKARKYRLRIPDEYLQGVFCVVTHLETARNFCARAPGDRPRILRVANPCVNPPHCKPFASAC